MDKVERGVMIKTDLLLRIYKTVRIPKVYKYPPKRKHYNMHLYG